MGRGKTIKQFGTYSTKSQSLAVVQLSNLTPSTVLSVAHLIIGGSLRARCFGKHSYAKQKAMKPWFESNTDVRTSDHRIVDAGQ